MNTECSRQIWKYLAQINGYQGLDFTRKERNSLPINKVSLLFFFRLHCLYSRQLSTLDCTYKETKSYFNEFLGFAFDRQQTIEFNLFLLTLSNK